MINIGSHNAWAIVGTEAVFGYHRTTSRQLEPMRTPWPPTNRAERTDAMPHTIRKG